MTMNGGFSSTAYRLVTPVIEIEFQRPAQNSS